MLIFTGYKHLFIFFSNFILSKPFYNKYTYKLSKKCYFNFIFIK